MIKFIITGNPISSKNAIRSGVTKQGRNYTYTTKAVKDYRVSALSQLYAQTRYGADHYNKVTRFAYTDNEEKIYCDLPIQSYVQVSFIFYCKDGRKRDLVNLIQQPCDLLEQAGIIENDNLIISLDGSRIMAIDKENPRTIIEIKILEDK